MFEQVLPGKTKDLLALLGTSQILDDFYLAGGTSLALQLGHRISRDLDFFTRQEFNSEILAQRLQSLEKFKLERQSWGTLLGSFREVKFSAFYYRYSLIAPLIFWEGISVANQEDIAPMKLAAIAHRGTKRDFIDLFFMLKTKPLKEIFELYDKKYKNMRENFAHLFRSLTYFEDAEKDNMPEMLKPVSWEEVKKYLETETKKFSQELIGQ